MRSKERRKKKGSGNGKDNRITPNTGKLKGREKKQNTLLSAASNWRRPIVPRSIGRGQSSVTGALCRLRQSQQAFGGQRSLEYIEQWVHMLDISNMTPAETCAYPLYRVKAHHPTSLKMDQKLAEMLKCVAAEVAVSPLADPLILSLSSVALHQHVWLTREAFGVAPNMPRGKGTSGKRQRKDGYGIAPPLPVNEVLVDAAGGRWSLGRLFATGGFGSLYFVQRVDGGPCYALERNSCPTMPLCMSRECSETPAVAKLELSSNGPLFQEIHLYQRVGQKRRVDDWKESHGLTFFGMPYLLASGIHHSFGREYRFLIIPRYGISVECLRSSAGGAFRPFAVFRLAISCLNVLQYLHCNRYVYADLKGDNILVENLNVTEYTAEVEIWKSYVIDFGLAYVVSSRTTYKPESKNAHNGTRDFTSIDAHCGASPSFRGDVEILGYNFLLWLSGCLPWSDCSSADAVFELKKVLKANLRQELKKILFGELSFAVKPAQSFFEHVYALGYTDSVDFDLLRSILEPFTVVKETGRSTRNVSSQSDKATVISSPVAKKAKANIARRLGVKKKNVHVKFAECSPETSEYALDEKRVTSQTSKQVLEAKRTTPGSCSARIVPGLKNFPSTTQNSILRRLSTMVRKKYTHLTEPRHISSNGVAHPTNVSGHNAAELHAGKIDSTSSSRQYVVTPSGRRLRPR
ncbi:hypothetical protein M514_15907 [Trichuris suis]|uniref:non-specific serine/threonine protein kinase n=1 Tax=Trichuris suis TaxID=68888 RepID=A0A085NQQ1_9BILA|nr:hypothetical protein M514_15907 [Trichuris suis]